MKNNKNNSLDIKSQCKKTCFNVTDSGINFVLSLILPMVAALVLVLLYAFFARLSGSNYETFSKTDAALIISLIYTPLIFLFIYLIYCRVCAYDPIKSAGFISKLDYKKVIIVVAIGVVAVFLVSPLISLFDHLYSFLGYNPDNSLPYVMDNGVKYVVGLIAMAVVPAVCEEIMFRGLIQKGLMTKFNPHIAIIMSSAMFTLLHGSLQQTAFQFILGLALGYVAYYCGSVSYSILLHFVNNAIVVTISFIYTLTNVDVNKETVSYSSAWDYIYPILLFILAAAIIVGLMFLINYINKKFGNKDEGVENQTTALSTENQIAEQNVQPLQNKTKQLTSNETVWLVFGFVLGVVIWVSNTFISFW